MNGIQRTPLLYVGLGFTGGVIIARNAEPMSNAQTSSVILAMLVGGFVLWRAGYRGKAEAVATAVAVAVANAHSEANAHAQAVAQQAVHIVLNSGEVQTIRQNYSDEAIEAVKAADHQFAESIERDSISTRNSFGRTYKEKDWETNYANSQDE